MMEGHLIMSQKERTRLGVMKQIEAKRLSLVAAAALLKLSYRQLKRVWCRYGQQGDAGLVHQGRGRSSNRQADPKVRERIIQRYEQRYTDFGPTLAAEHLEREGLRVDHETLRRWLLSKGLWSVKRRRQKHRRNRARQAGRGKRLHRCG